MALDVEVGRELHAGAEEQPDVEAAAGVPDEMDRAGVVLQRPGHRREHALRPARQRCRRQGGHHVDVHAEAAAGEGAQEILADVREVLQVAEVGEAEEARNEVDVVHHGWRASTGPQHPSTRARRDDMPVVVQARNAEDAVRCTPG